MNRGLENQELVQLLVGRTIPAWSLKETGSSKDPDRLGLCRTCEQSGLSSETIHKAEVAIDGDGHRFGSSRVSTSPSVRAASSAMVAGTFNWLIERITTSAPAHQYTSLLADEPRRAPRERQDYVPTAPGSIGMSLGSVSALRGHAAQ